LILADETGEARTTSSTGASPGKTVQMTPVDTNAQEAGRAISFIGPGGSVLITGPSADFSQAAKQDWALSFKVKTRAATPAGASIGLNGKVFKLADILSSPTEGAWRPVMVPLSCFTAAGIDLAQVYEPLRINVNAPWTIGVADVQLTPFNGAPGSCPAVIK
jgi:beta-glucosidase